MEATTHTGTTLAIMQAYPLGTLEVEFNLFGKTQRGLITGLSTTTATVDNSVSGSHEGFMPVLRPFSALCTPLEDGPVPALEVAKLIAGDAEWSIVKFSKGRVIVLEDRRGNECVIKDMVSPAIGWTFDVYAGCTHQSLLDVCGAYDYLRSKHFAVGLEPGQFIPKG